MSIRHYGFQHAIVRDLAWVINSPVMLDANDSVMTKSANLPVAFVSDSFCQQQYQQQTDWLLQQDQHPQALQSWLAQRHSHRLGYYFESLVEYWLRHWVGDGFLAAHVPVRREKHTLGEFDFLYNLPAATELHHWEVAVKFYLAFQSTQGETLFYGPQSRDRLDVKVARLLEHQTLLSQSYEGLQTIRACGAPADLNTVVPEVLLKGYLFYPAEMDWQSAPLQSSTRVSADHLRGWWTCVRQLRIPISSRESRWYQLSRLQWLAPLYLPVGKDLGVMTHRETIRFCHEWFVHRKEPFLLVELAPENGGGWREISRGFVVQENWPESGYS